MSLAVSRVSTHTATVDAATSFDMTRFEYRLAGTFGLSLDAGSHVLSLTYTLTAVPEPGTLALVAAAAMGGWSCRRRRFTIA